MMTKIEIIINAKTHHLELISTWTELTYPIWKKIYPYIETTQIYQKPVISSLITKGNKKVLEKIPQEGFLPIYHTIDWLIQEPCIHPPFKFLKIKNKKYHLPAPRLENLTIIEFAFLDMAWELSRFFEGRGEEAKANEWLTKLCLYMARPIDKRINPKDPETYMGDRRERFNTAVIDQRWPIFQKIDPAYRFGCIWFFLGCKAHIHQKYKGKLWFDTHDQDGNEIIGVQKNDKPQPLRWIGICRKLAGGKFGNLKETQFAGLYDVLEELVGQRGRR